MNKILPIEECAFEPESTEIRCIECGKLTGIMGTCADVGFCAHCREQFIQGCMEDGTARTKAEVRFSEMVIGMIEGAGYKAKYVPRRVLHLSVDGRPACGIKGGPHPLTENKNEANCKRCVVNHNRKRAGA